MKTKVLLYSGGMDSYILSHLEKPDICLYIDVRGIYSKKERENLIKPAHGKLIIDTLDIGKFERGDVLPMRNAYFILNAAQYGEEIILGSVDGDRAYDNHSWCATLMEMVTNYIHQDKRLKDSRIKVRLPCKDKTKIQLLQDFISSGGDPMFLYESVSCYDSELLHCGKCKACIRKWVSMVHCNLNTKKLFTHDPQVYLDKMKPEEFISETEEHEAHQAVMLSKGILSHKEGAAL